MYYNKRLHQRSPGEHGDHYPGCALHDIETGRSQRSSASPMRSNGSSRYSSLSSLNQRKLSSRHSTPTLKLTIGVNGNGNGKTNTSISKRDKRDSLGDNSNSSALSNSSVQDSDDSLSRFKAAVNGSRSKSVGSLNSRISPSKQQYGAVQIKSCDSPDQIIATLFPVTEFQTGGKGKCINRSYSSGLNGSGTGKRDYHYRNGRGHSVSSDNSSSMKSRSTKSAGRLLSVERDFENLR